MQNDGKVLRDYLVAPWSDDNVCLSPFMQPTTCFIACCVFC